MQVNYKRVQNTRYSETDQQNPIRFMGLKQVANEVFENTTEPFKCKDYFNDFVVQYRSKCKPFPIYGMCSDQGVFDEHGGMYVLMFNLCAEFEQNVDNVIRKVFGEEFGVDLTITRLAAGELTGTLGAPNAAVVYLSKECFKSTFVVSALMLFIRNCNIPIVIPDYDARVDLGIATEGGWNYDIYKVFKERKFKDFPQLTQYYWYSNPEYNSEKKNGTSYIHHSNGATNWLGSLIPRNVWSGLYNYVIPTLYTYPDVDADEEDWDEDEEYCEENN